MRCLRRMQCVRQERQDKNTVRTEKGWYTMAWAKACAYQPFLNEFFLPVYRFGNSRVISKAVSVCSTVHLPFICRIIVRLLSIPIPLLSVWSQPDDRKFLTEIPIKWSVYTELIITGYFFSAYLSWIIHDVRVMPLRRRFSYTTIPISTFVNLKGYNPP